jgi:hypothetical protein
LINKASVVLVLVLLNSQFTSGVTITLDEFPADNDYTNGPLPAALHRFGQSVEQVPVGGIAAVFDGHETDLRMSRALATLANKTQRMEVLGSFPRSKPVG